MDGDKKETFGSSSDGGGARSRTTSGGDGYSVPPGEKNAQDATGNEAGQTSATGTVATKNPSFAGGAGAEQTEATKNAAATRTKKKNVVGGG